MTTTSHVTVYKILSASDWDAACLAGSYAGSADDVRDGFIHLSTADQLAGTAARHFKGQSGLVLVALDAASLGPALRWEPSRGGALFPHLYGALDPRAARSATLLRLTADDVPAIPQDLLP